ncbi:MAG: SGNH/GDSL hydrolase family protein [Arcicella sp.]|jgi:lysophospholipase L1-like esterase|nr:SGNH/GDSL hydrolase family protein [Arcicella sp.]
MPFLIFIFIILSCSSEKSDKHLGINMAKSNQPTRTFLALGDSYTIGESVPETDRWSRQLIDLLRNDFQITKHDIVARTGWTTDELITAIEDKNITEQYDMVSLLIGVNNQYRGESTEKYRTEFRELLKIATRFAKNDAQNVLLLSIPDWGYSPFAEGKDKQKIEQEIDFFNQIAKEECKKVNISFIDITEITRKNTATAMFASDGLHYSVKMHSLWAKEALQTALEILK